jgi:hypothetical protein
MELSCEMDNGDKHRLLVSRVSLGATGSEEEVDVFDAVKHIAIPIYGWSPEMAANRRSMVYAGEEE